MNYVQNGLHDSKEIRDSKYFSSGIFDEKLFNQPGHSISTKIAKYIFFNLPAAETKADSNSARKDTSNSNACSFPGLLNQITLKYVFDFFEILLKKFRTELNFHITNGRVFSKLNNMNTTNDPRLTTIKSLLDFDAFTLINKKENLAFYKIEAIIERLKSMIGILENAVNKISKENLSKSLVFFEEIECLKCFMKNFPETFFENDYFRKVCSELWRFMRDNQFIDPTEHNLQTVYDILKLYIYGISFPSPNPEDYPLHKAVYTNNLAMVRRVCAREKSPVFHAHIEQSDPAGVTPLMLAVLLGNKDAAMILVNHGANPKLRSYPYARTPSEESIYKKNRGMIKIMLLASTYIKQLQWEENKRYLIDFLKTVPDFSFEMSWECDSKIIPFVKKVTPSDVYKVYKRGSSIRIDLSLLGWSKLKSIRGDSSIIFNGIGSEEGKLLMIDHLKKTSADMLSEMSSLALENKVDELIKQEHLNSEVRTENVVFKPATNWKGENIKSNINGYDCTKCIAKGTFSLLFTKRNVVIDIDAKQFTTLEQYFEHIMKQPLWILENSKGVVDWNDSPIMKIRRYTDSYQAAVKTLFEKEDKENESSLANTQKSRKGADMTNVSQKKLMKNYTKNIVATIYTCDTLPLNLDHFLPVLEILSNISPPINRLKGFLEKTLAINRTSFPIKACIPIFFSLNAILSIKGFKFLSPDPSLFDIQTMLHRASNKMSGYERFRTEGGSDDEHIQQRWQEFLKHDSEEESAMPPPMKFEYQEGESDVDSEEAGVVEENEKLIQSFFKKTGENNQDFVDVYASDEEDEDEDENLDDFDISEKYRNETLKLSAHGTHIPKTIATIQQKFQTSPMNSVPRRNILDRTSISKDPRKSLEHPYTIVQNKKGENIHALKSKSNYKFMGSLNPQIQKKEVKSRSNKRESLGARNFNEMRFSENYKELQTRKIKKYTQKKQNLLAKASQSKERISRDDIVQGSINLQKSFKAMKHERTKSLDLPQKHFETFLNTMGMKDI